MKFEKIDYKGKIRYIFDQGGLWEDNGITILKDHEIEIEKGKMPCKHCYSEKIQYSDIYGGKKRKQIFTVVPRVVLAINEGGYNSTGVCLDCLLEIAKILDKE